MLQYLVILGSQLRRSLHAPVSPQPDHEVASPRRSCTAPLLTTNDPSRTLFLRLLCFHEVTNCPSSWFDSEVPYFHNLTSCFFHKCFVFILMQVARGCALSPSFAPPRVSGSPRGRILHGEANITATTHDRLPTTHYSPPTLHYPLPTFRNRMIPYDTR